MHLVEQHIIERRDPRFAHIDEAAFESKNLYNAALYELRQAFIFQGRYIPYEEMDKRMQRHEAYRKLPAKVAQKVLDQLDKMWQSYFEACKEYREHPEKFLGHPRLPKYKHKTEGRNLLVYTIQAISRGKKGLKRGSIKPSMLPITVKTKQDPATIDQVRIVPRKGCYVVEVVYEKAVVQADVNPAWYAGIDLGINNLAAVASNKPGFQPVVVNGRPVKSINQFYNKRMAELQKKLGHTGTTRRMGRIATKLTEESYTSQASFLDRDEMPVYDPNRTEEPAFSGKRLKKPRGLYRASGKRNVNADINGAYNIIRKVAPKAFAEDAEDFVVHPVRMTLAK
jgi:transposase